MNFMQYYFLGEFLTGKLLQVYEHTWQSRPSSVVFVQCTLRSYQLRSCVRFRSLYVLHGAVPFRGFHT